MDSIPHPQPVSVATGKICGRRRVFLRRKRTGGRFGKRSRAAAGLRLRRHQRRRAAEPGFCQGWPVGAEQRHELSRFGFAAVAAHDIADVAAEAARIYHRWTNSRGRSTDQRARLEQLSEERCGGALPCRRNLGQLRRQSRHRTHVRQGQSRLWPTDGAGARRAGNEAGF